MWCHQLGDTSNYLLYLFPQPACKEYLSISQARKNRSGALVTQDFGTSLKNHSLITKQTNVDCWTMCFFILRIFDESNIGSVQVDICCAKHMLRDETGSRFIQPMDCWWAYNPASRDSLSKGNPTCKYAYNSQPQTLTTNFRFDWTMKHPTWYILTFILTKWVIPPDLGW